MLFYGTRLNAKIVKPLRLKAMNYKYRLPEFHEMFNQVPSIPNFNLPGSIPDNLVPANINNVGKTVKIIVATVVVLLIGYMVYHIYIIIHKPDNYRLTSGQRMLRS